MPGGQKSLFFIRKQTYKAYVSWIFTTKKCILNDAAIDICT